MNQDEVINLFEESNALLHGHFKLTSGRHSDIYYEKFALLRQPSLCTKICEQMSEMFKSSGSEIVVGPTTGGIIIAYDIGRYLDLPAIYAEAGGEGETARVFKRGMGLKKGQRVLIVDDVLTTGRSIFEVIDLVKSCGGEIVGIGEMLDRSNGQVKFDYPYRALATVDARSWEPADCPLCAKKLELTQRGSRKF